MYFIEKVVFMEYNDINVLRRNIMCEADKINSECEAANHDCSQCGSGDGHGGCSHSHGEAKSQTVQEYLDITYKQNLVVVAKLDKIIDNLVKTGRDEAAMYLQNGVAEFEKGNMMLNLALSMINAE